MSDKEEKSSPSANDKEFNFNELQDMIDTGSQQLNLDNYDQNVWGLQQYQQYFVLSWHKLSVVALKKNKIFISRFELCLILNAMVSNVIGTEMRHMP